MATDRFIIPGNEIVPSGEIPLFAGSLASILIPCCGMLEYTKLCVACRASSSTAGNRSS
jgi:hypothetical protein